MTRISRLDPDIFSSQSASFSPTQRLPELNHMNSRNRHYPAHSAGRLEARILAPVHVRILANQSGRLWVKAEAL